MTEKNFEKQREVVARVSPTPLHFPPSDYLKTFAKIFRDKNKTNSRHFPLLDFYSPPLNPPMFPPPPRLITSLKFRVFPVSGKIRVDFFFSNDFFAF